MTRRRRGFLIGVIAVFAMLLSACAGLPTTGEVKSGFALDDVDLPPDISQIAAGPLEGASPEEIVEGFWMPRSRRLTDGRPHASS